MIKEYATEDIKITPSIKKALDQLKIHPREPYYEVIQRLLDYMSMQPLTSDKK